MRKLLFCLLFPFALSQSFAQLENKIVLGNIDSIQSNILNEQRKIWVYVPNSGETDTYARVKYPVVYLLDGDGHFYYVAGMIHQLSSVNTNTILPEMIVVGIPNTDRTRDLTPTHIDLDPLIGNDSNFTRTSGGGEQFMAFIEKELMPYIDSTYPTLPYKTFIGHSIGALTVMNALINHKNLFNAYVAIDPSMWWDNRNLLNKAAVALSKDNYQNKTLYLGISNTMSEGMDTATVRKDTNLTSRHIKSILSLNDVLQQTKNNGLSYKYRYYNDENHGSVPLMATYDALHFIFSFYNFKFTDEDFFNISMNTVEKIETHFKDVSNHFGFTYPPPEVMINQMGYVAMSMQKMDVAEKFFTMNINNYPASFNGYDSMGDFQAANNDKAKAIKNYEKALSIKELPGTRKKLNDLLNKK